MLHTGFDYPHEHGDVRLATAGRTATAMDTRAVSSDRRGFNAWAPRVTVLIGVTGVVLGVIGYRLFPEPVPWPDAIYSGIQLFGLNTFSPPDGSATPVALEVARFLTALTLGSAVLLVLARFGVVGRDRFQAQFARGQRVVIGDTLEAQQLATSSVEPWSSRRSRLRPVLVASLSDDEARRVRSLGVVVVSPGGRRQLNSAVRGATDVVFALGDDLEALRAANLVRDCRDLPSNASIRVLLRSPALAGSMQGQPGTNPTITSLSQAIALNLCTERFPTRVGRQWHHVVVAGEGDYAEELAVAAVLPWFVPGETIYLDLIGGSANDWMRSVSARVDGFAEIRRWPCAVVPSALTNAIREACVGRETIHLIFIAGVDPAAAVSIGIDMAREFPDSRVVSLLVHSSHSETADPTQSGAPENWSPQYVGRLLENRDLLRLNVHERLGRRLLGELNIWRGAYDGELLAQFVGSPNGIVDQTHAEAAAALLMEAYAEHGYRPQVALSANTAVMPEMRVIGAVAKTVIKHRPAADTQDNSDWRTAILRLVERTPPMMAGLGYSLIADKGVARDE